MVGDPIGDFINRLKTAQAARASSVSVPFSELKLAIAEVLKREGFIKEIEKKGKKVKKTLEIALSYGSDGRAEISDAARISKPSRRLYYRVSDIRPVKSGFGLLILSTPKGIMTGAEAKKQNVGGEPLFKIW